MKKTSLLLRNFYLIPKTIWLLSFLICFNVIGIRANAVYSQTVKFTAHFSNVTVEEVFKYVEQNSEYIFLYYEYALDTKRKVNFSVEQQELNIILDKMFSKTDVAYTIDDRQVIVKKKDSELLQGNQQQVVPIQVSGVVRDQNGETIPGVNVLLKGTTIGTVSGLDGQFSITVPNQDAILLFSYISFENKEVVVGDQKELQVSLSSSVESLNEVVVTALGIKRQTKALGYAIQELKGETMTEARENNIVNSLTGKIAGVDINRSGNGPGGSSRMVIRGNNSIGGNNQPLVIVDGIPVSNFSGGANNEWGGIDRGNGLSDINPDDIETISVLKGAAAAALYGSRAGNGVLMITTKKGAKRKGLGVTVNSNLTIETPLVKPEMQNVYGQGSNGVFNANSNYSWGPKMEGQLLTDWTGVERPFTAYGNDISDYLETGVTTNNSVELSVGSDNVSFRGTLSNMHYDGSIPSNSLDRTTLTLRTTANLNSKLIVDSKINYVRQSSDNRPKLSGDPENIFLNYLMMPRSVHYSDLEGGSDQYGNLKRWTTDENNYILNPYWTNRYNTTADKRDRFIGFISLQYDITKWMTLKLRHGEDMYFNANDQKYYAGTPFWNLSESGDYSCQTENFRERNSDALLTFNKENWWDSKFSGNLSLGGNLMYQTGVSNNVTAGKLTIPNFFAISNGRNPVPYQYKWEKAVNSFYGFAQLNYGDFFFLDLTARNDWSSTLPKHNRSFFYPSVGAGLVVSDMLNQLNVGLPKFFSFIKLRASYAEVGNDAGVYQLLPTYEIFSVIGDIKGARPGQVLPLSDLKPEMIKSSEFGVDLRFFNSRLGVDFTYYKKNATNQILALPISSTTGKLNKMINAGSVENKGVELVVKATPIQITDGFRWDVTINYSKNNNKIKELHPEAKEYLLAKTDFVNVVATEGGSYGDLYGRAFQRNEQGQVLVDNNGLPLLEGNLSTKLGNYTPKWIGGFLNSFSYKSLSMSALIDVRWKGAIYMNSLSRAAKYGTSEMTLKGREEYYAGTGGIVVDGVNANQEKNNIAVNPQDYWDRVSRASELFVYDATSIRLRELSLGYTFSSNLLSKTPFTSMKLSFVGRNLWLIKSEIPGYDPESAYSTGNGQGIEYGSMPSFRNFGLNLNVSF